MDSLTQVLMGAVIGQLVLGPKHLGKGALIGGFAGTLPDLDIIPLMGSSMITQLVHHRGLSHSLLFCLSGPFAFSWLCKRFFKWKISFKRWWIFWFLAFLTHILLDLMTTWGTQILWPIPIRFSLDALFIIDPLVTIPLLIGCLWATWKRSYRPAAWGLALSCVYMTFAIGAQTYMTRTFTLAFQQPSIPIRSLLVRPTPFNTLFWSVTARTPHDTLVMGYARLWDSVESISFSDPIPQQTDMLTDLHQRTDIQRLLAITKGYYVIDKTGTSLTIKDARFGRLGGWNTSSSDRFVFNYVLDMTTFTWRQHRPSMPDSKKMLLSLVRNILK